ncbi:MAG TPA: aromatic ring-hydroxylating dioxygenase subunit alpha [Candidatus Binataceae bacterium]|nr:aromatic ring-hydroxylating dioxygenase subunit alpha [Candidatus Binataceae bacterium]
MTTEIINKRWAKKFPELGTAPIAAEPCVSPQFFERERERIFRRSWLCLGNVCELPERGDYIVREVAICDASILVMRGQDGVVRGFHNVCSHRGNTLAWDAAGRCRGYLTCNFHSWGYDSTGQLKWIPDAENFFGLDQSKLGLTPIATEIFNGFIFINLDPHETLTEYLEGVTERLPAEGFDQLRLQRMYRINERANWKVAMDAQNEGYHVFSQHRYLMPNLFITTKEGCLRSAEMTFFGRHSVSGSDINPAYQPFPLEGAMFQIDKGPSRCRLPMRNAFEFHMIFPNFAMLFFRFPANDYCITHNFWPLSADRTLWEIRFYAPTPLNAAERLSQDFMQVFNRVVFDEDATAHETVYAGLASRAKQYLILQDEEIAIRHFHEVLDRQLAGQDEA